MFYGFRLINFRSGSLISPDDSGRGKEKNGFVSGYACVSEREIYHILTCKIK